MNTPERPFDAEHGDGADPEGRDLLSPGDEALIDQISNHYIQNPGKILANEAYEYNTTIFDMARRLHFWCGYGRDDNVSWAAVYSALHFALFVGHIRNGEEGIQPNLTEFMTRVNRENAEALDVMEEMATEYFCRHPSEEGLVKAFMGEIDPSEMYAHDAESVFGLVMDSIERGSLLNNVPNQLNGIRPNEDKADSSLIEALEEDMHIDISSVCNELAEVNQALLPAAIEAFTVECGREPNLDDSRDVSVLRVSMRDWFFNKWPQIENAPMIGDTIITNGRGILMSLMVNEEGVDGFGCLRLNNRVQIRGTFKGFDTQSYLDQAVLDLDEKKQSEVGDSYLRSFGVHFVLEDVVVIGGNSDEMQSKLYYLPLHYPDMKILLMRTALLEDNER